ncbi:hypothetical protein D3C71_1534000 [compost metagenome]
MSGKSVYCKYTYITEPILARLKNRHVNLSHSLKTSYYLTEPTIPATKCFCIRKNTSAVGRVAMTIASIIKP